MSSSPQQPNPEPGPEPIPEETKEEAKEEVKPEMKEGKNGETEEEKKEEEKEETKVEKEEDKKEESKKEKKDSWKDFIYNPRTGEFMGRTASSWGLILLFYLVFYGFLTAMFCLTMWVMLQTLDENVPRRQDRVANPGLVVRPHAAEISFNRSDLTNYNEYTRQLHELLQRYWTKTSWRPLHQLYRQERQSLANAVLPTRRSSGQDVFPILREENSSGLRAASGCRSAAPHKRRL
ncbi:sodium/potassium-transporting ATPase subunit beta-3-like [Xyrichtys novacula]|uniref:Sodium/potassium-transporting ATPase subunit beta-3 n=1 Tax=Xyrichtys novacula TaxID=13765 RepID=A0AAV1G1V4_XYRNO|nr:sodium/potassium-transporting ATPase subunit beta-3-like [Xyrichtys novacula]